MSVVATRLKQARLRAGFSQERLGALAGIEEASASARMNQYERDKHTPDYSTLVRIAKALDVPVEYFYARSEDVATLSLNFHQLPAAKRSAVLKYVADLLA